MTAKEVERAALLLNALAELPAFRTRCADGERLSLCPTDEDHDGVDEATGALIMDAVEAILRAELAKLGVEA